jgi:hypothetical protein
MTTDNFCFYLQNRLIQTSHTGGQWYSDTSPFSIPCLDLHRGETLVKRTKTILANLSWLRLRMKNLFSFVAKRSNLLLKA